MIAAPKSGSGKTLITCALLRLLQKKGKNPASFKCGPDYIDPLFHEQVLSLPSTNLDSYFSSEEEIKSIFARNFTENHCDSAVIEGVMGFFDGLAGRSSQASSYEIAAFTKCPVILVIDGRGMSRSILALIKGFCSLEKENLIAGIILNKVTKSTFLLQKKLIEEELKLPLLGFLPEESALSWQSRHLGLFLPFQIKDLNKQIDAAAQILEENLDFEKLDEIMNSSPDLDFNECQSFPGSIKKALPENFTLAIAKDQAFCFYYRENIRLLENLGVKIKYFSPLNDQNLPQSDACLFGGGYPELYAKKLEENRAMRSQIKDAVKSGKKILAECGGFMYLQNYLRLENGENFQMCGAIEGESFFTGKLLRFGYAEFTCKNGGAKIKGHEFHYFDSRNNGQAFKAEKPLSSKSWDCMIFEKNILAGYPHLYYPSNPDFIAEFLSR